MAGKTTKIPKYSYSLLLDNCVAEKSMNFWSSNFVEINLNNEDWEEIHLRNFKCSIESRLRSFYFKVFHRAIAFRDFLFKIKRIETPECSFCGKEAETPIHIFCECEVVIPLWTEIENIFRLKSGQDFQLNNFNKIFGICKNNLFTYIILCTKFFIYRCKFQDKKPHVNGLKSFIGTQKDIEHNIAKKRDKLSLHLNKWAFVL